MSTVNIDKNYCFIDDAIENKVMNFRRKDVSKSYIKYNHENYTSESLEDDLCIRKIDTGEKILFYADADEYSTKLYDCLLKFVKAKEHYERKGDFEVTKYHNGIVNKSFKVYKVYGNINNISINDCDIENLILGSDYIGPSKSWAHFVGLDDKIVGLFIKECRVLGGHMMFPRRYGSINITRGGSSAKGGVFDRFDITLLLIQQKYKNFDFKSEYISGLNGKLENEWFKTFISFENFIEYWNLNDYVRIDNGKMKVINLVTGDKFSDEEISNINNGYKGNINYLFPGCDKEKEMYLKNELINYNSKKNINQLKDIINDESIIAQFQESYKNYIDNNINVIKKRNEKMWECIMNNK